MTSVAAAICRVHRNNLKRHLPQKEKAFYAFPIEFLKCAWNLEHFFKKDEYPKLIISEIIDSERRGRLNI